MNNIAISPQIFMYALQNQNVERKIAKQIDIGFLKNENKSEEIDLKTESTSQNYQNIPDILIPNDNNSPSFTSEIHIGETLINNDNIEIITSEIDSKLNSEPVLSI